MTDIANDYPQIAAAYDRVKALTAAAVAAGVATMDDPDNAGRLDYDFANAEEQAARASLADMMQKAITEREAAFWAAWHAPVVVAVEAASEAPAPIPEPPAEV